ncbi:hypothetical protein ACX80O_03890 [Arthrobacter sp. Hz1]
MALKQKAQEWVCTGEGLSVSTDAKGKPVQQFTALQAEAQLEGESPPSFSILADDYDTWCECGDVCRRKITSYIAETKGNAAYGNTSGVTGSFDIVIRTNLNGRQANSRVTRIWDSGPALAFTSSRIRCWETATFRPSTCGSHDAGNVTVSSSSKRHTSGLIYGNRLNNSNEYYNQFTSYFTPTGYPRQSIRALNTLQFNCYGADNCYFP